MASASTQKRTIKLRHADSAGREFIKVSPRNKTKWASCYKPDKAKGFKARNTIPTLGYFALSNFETQLLFGVPAALGILATGGALGYGEVAKTAIAKIAGTGEVTLQTTYTAEGIFAGFQYFVTGTSMTIAEYQAALAAAGLSAELTTAGQMALGAVATGLSFFLSKDVKQPEFTNFNKPCDPGEGKY